MTPGVVSDIVAAAVVSFVVVTIALPLLRRHGVMDLPAGRSLHMAPTPRGGGVGIVASLGAGPGVAVLSDDGVLGSATSTAMVALGAVAVLGVVGFADDVWSLSVGPRLFAQGGAAAAWAASVLAFEGRGAVLVPLIAVVTVVLVNMTNFMDGVNGLVAGHAAIAGLWYVVAGAHYGVPGVALIACAVIGGAVGFLPFNLVRARLFLGDVGSYTLGGVWGVLSTWLLLHSVPVEVALAPLAVLVTDAGVTLIRRLFQGDAVFQPHRLHVYQRVTQCGWSHHRVTGVFAGVTLLACLLAVPALTGASRPTRAAMGLATLAVCAGYVSLPRLAGQAARWETVRRAATR